MTEHSSITNMPKAYDPSNTEDRIYNLWESNGYFTPEIDKAKEPFVMIMPPPNVTGELHMGHALTFAIEDLIVRWHRMLGEPTLFLPGTDHAGIATQVVVERMLASEGTTRLALGREKFEARIWDWVEEYGQRITNQLKKLGTSCDWSRTRFTLDQGPRKAVRRAFVDLYKERLIYKGERITNWCTRCATALSDLEVKYKEIEGGLHEIRYPLTGDNDDYLVVATTRPETMLGDTAIAVSPNDNNLKHLIGRSVLLPFVDREIPIIGDDAVDPEFGTGALKVTPAHAIEDYDIGLRHGLDAPNVINTQGEMNELAGPFSGQTVERCRQEILERLDEKGLLQQSNPYTHTVGHCDRCDSVIEPMISKQWYVSMSQLAEPAIKAVKTGEINIIPNRFANVYFNWMENIRDWPVSRQLWWGHQIPVWYCSTCPDPIVDYTNPLNCPSCRKDELTRDPDVLDTWFSSGLWPHSTLGWPDDTEDLDYYYPGSVMETGHDILFFWVARMIMFGLHHMGKPPFHTVYLHGLVVDPEGSKMSKTKGNVQEPLELIDQYGADAVRFALTTGSAPGNNIRSTQQRLEASRNFVNKLWNASRFVLTLAEDAEIENWRDPSVNHVHDQWIISELETCIIQIDKYMKDYQFGEAPRVAHDFLWHNFCDWYIELAKIRIRTNDPISPLPVLLFILEKTLRLLHPFLPFVTEEIWMMIRKQFVSDANWPETLMFAKYPTEEMGVNRDTTFKEMICFFDCIKGIRNMRAELHIKPNVRISYSFQSKEFSQFLESQKQYFSGLAGLNPEPISPLNDTANELESIPVVTESAIVHLFPGEAFEKKKEIERLRKEHEEVVKHIGSLRGRLSNNGFRENAPAEIVNKEEVRLENSISRKNMLETILAGLKDGDIEG